MLPKVVSNWVGKKVTGQHSGTGVRGTLIFRGYN
jgi:hypothetical protein